MDIQGEFDIIAGIVSDFGFDIGPSLPPPVVGTAYYLDPPGVGIGKSGLYVCTKTGWHNVNEAYEGSGPPNEVPDYYGQLYIDHANEHLYMSTGVTSLTDWLLLKVKGSEASSGVPVYLDQDRLISINSTTFNFALKGTVRNVYLNTITGVSSNTLGYFTGNSGLITKVSLQVLDLNLSWGVDFYLYDRNQQLGVFSLNTESTSYETNMQVTANSVISAYAYSVLSFDNPVCRITVHWT